MVYYFGKVPLILVIVFMHQYPLQQSICVLAYCVLLMAVNCRFSYRRKMYRNLTYYMHVCVIGAALLIVLQCCQLDVSEWLDVWVLLSMGGMLAATILQLVSNHEMLSSVYFYMRWKFFKRK